MSERTHGREVNDVSAGNGAQAFAQLRARIAALELENGQLRRALESRIAIEQAKGMLSERFEIDPDDAFLLLRRSARSSRRELHALAVHVAASRQTPPEVLACLDGDG